MKELREIQARLVAPKGQRNTFGNYNFRNCADILEALKPHLENQKCTLVIVDEIASNNDRVYVKATATFTNSAGEFIVATAFAREAMAKKGMDEAQITGAASSYARKYCLCGLFLIDDSTEDPDHTNKHKEAELITDEQVTLIYTIGTKAGIDKGSFRKLLRRFSYGSAKQITVDDFEAIKAEVEKFA